MRIIERWTPILGWLARQILLRNPSCGTIPTAARLKHRGASMKPISVRAIAIRVIVFFLTLNIGVGLTFARYIYIHRQAVFAEAASGGDVLRMEVLYPLGIDVNASGCVYRSCFNPLWGAAWDGHNDAIQFLLDRGADVNAMPGFGMTPLMVAAYEGHESTVRLLLSRGADANAENDGETALTLAKQNGNREIARLLRQAGAKETP